MPNYTVAFAGSGESTLENTKALLNDFFNLGPEDKEGFPSVPEDLSLRVILPISENHATASVMTVFDWTEYAGFDYVGILDEVVAKSKRQSTDVKALIEYAHIDPDEVINVNAEIIEALKVDQKDGQETYLFLFWGENGDDDCEILLDLAGAADIKVKDMTAGLDALVFGDPLGAEPEPEKEPEPEPAPRRRGRARQPLAEEDTPLEDKPEPEPEEKPARRTRKADAAKPETLQEKVDQDLEKAIEEPLDPDGLIMGDHNKATRQDTDDVLTKALALKHEAKAKPVSEDLRNRAGYHRANDDTAPLHTAIRKVTQDFMHILDGLVPNSREKSLALTNAEQAMFWANAAVARQGALVTPEEAESPSVDQEPSQPSRGRGRPRNDGEPTKPRTAAEKAVKEVWDEESETWERAGRGRIPKDVKTRLVDPKTGEPVSE